MEPIVPNEYKISAVKSRGGVTRFLLFSLWIAFLVATGRFGVLLALLFQHGPVKDVVVDVVQRSEENAEQLTQVHVIGRLLKTQSATVVQVHRELGREALAQGVDGRAHFLLRDAFLFVFCI